MTDFNKLIPELPSWNNGRGIKAYTWIGCIGNYEHAIGYSTFFWPDFIEFEDYLFPNTNQPTGEQVIYLAELLKQIWECKLQRDFPARKFTVEIYDASDLQITFWQPRHKKSP